MDSNTPSQQPPPAMSKRRPIPRKVLKPGMLPDPAKPAAIPQASPPTIQTAPVTIQTPAPAIIQTLPPAKIVVPNATIMPATVGAGSPSATLGLSASINPYNLKPTDVGITDGVMWALTWLLKSSNVLLVAGKKRTGKTHLLAWLTWYSVMFENAEVLTNMVYKQRQQPTAECPQGKFKLGYPPGVTYVNTLLDIMLHTARIMTESPTKKLIIVMDEIQNFIAAYDWNSPLARDFVIFLGIISKLRQTYILSTPDYRMFPRGIRDPDADVATVLLYKDIAHTHDFNRECGTNYKTKELVFVERPGCEKEAWLIGICPWARPEDTVKPGEYVYDHLVPGSRFSLGQVGGYMFDFRDIIERLEHQIAEDIPDQLIKWVGAIKAHKRYMDLSRGGRIPGAPGLDQPQVSASGAPNTETGFIRIPEITPDMTPEQCMEVEDKAIFPYLARKTDVIPVDITKKGLTYSDTSIYQKFEREYQKWDRDVKRLKVKHRTRGKGQQNDEPEILPQPEEAPPPTTSPFSLPGSVRSKDSPDEVEVKPNGGP